MAFKLTAVHGDDTDVFELGTFPSKDLARTHVINLDNEGRWPDGYDALLFDIETGEKLFLDGDDTWTPLD